MLPMNAISLFQAQYFSLAFYINVAFDAFKIYLPIK